MSFFKWLRFGFFDLKENVDAGNIATALGNAKVTATCNGRSTLVICDSEGVIHLIDRDFNVTTFQGYLINVCLAVHHRTHPLLVTVGNDEEGTNPWIKIYDTSRSDRQGNPVCSRNWKVSPNTKLLDATAISLAESCNFLAIGFQSGEILLYRGNVRKDRNLTPKIVKCGNDAITGLAFKSISKSTYLFVTTTSLVRQYNVTIKDRQTEVSLDDKGCARKCSILADTIQDGPFMVARNDAVYCFTLDGRGPCFALEGEKRLLERLRGYLVIVSEDTDESLPMIGMNGNQSCVVTILDIQNKFIVYYDRLPNVIAIIPEWGSFYILTGEGRIHHLAEKDLLSKLSLLFKKNLYEIAIKIARTEQYDEEHLVDIFRQYADHLYAKGNYEAAVDQYVKTIGKLEPSYVICKFLDSQQMENLIKYLCVLHKQGVATSDHTTLLLNCYTKINDVHKLKEFILTKDGEVEFDVNIILGVCRKVSSEDALVLAEKYNLPIWYATILIEDFQNYTAAVRYIDKLDFDQAYTLVMKFGDSLIENVPEETTDLLKKLSSKFGDTGLSETIDRILTGDFIRLLLNNSERMVDFLEYLLQRSKSWEPMVYNTLIEHYLHIWSHSEDQTNKKEIEEKIMSVLQSSDSKYDKNHSLVLCTTRNFKLGILHLLQENKQYQHILRYHLNSKQYSDVLACCRRFSYLEPSLWIKALNAALTDQQFPTKILREILTVIEKEHLLSPVQVIEALCSSKALVVGDVRTYLQSVLKNESKIVEEESGYIEKYKAETQEIRQRIDKIKNNAVWFQASRCSQCNAQLELPSVHFMCQHSFHQHCYQSFSENEKCPSCEPKNRKIREVIESQENNRRLHEPFHNQLERADDPFGVLSEYLGRNMFISDKHIRDSVRKLKNLNEQARQSQDDHFSDRLYDKRINIPISSNKIDAYVNNSYNNSYEDSIMGNITFDAADRVKNLTGTTPSSVVSLPPTSTVDKKSKAPNSLNPFEGEDDYNEELNPFSEEDNDYDSNLNPFN